MLSMTFFGYAIAHLALWFWGWRAWSRYGRSTALLITLFVNTLLWYDNFRIGIGRFIGEGDLLYYLSLPSFFWHWSFLPLMVIVAGSLARMAGLGWARNKLVMGCFCLVAVALMVLDIPYAISLVFGQFGPLPLVELRPGCILDTLRYTTTVSPAQFCTPDAVAFSNGPAPIPAIAMNFIMVIVGVLLWKKDGWKWLAIGPGLMFFAAGGGPAFGVYALPVANFGEILFTLGVMATCVHYARLQHERGGRPGDAGAGRKPAPAPGYQAAGTGPA